jgi:hypothetical protein
MLHRNALVSAFLALGMLWPALSWSAEPAGKAESSATDARSAEPAVQRTVLEDDNVRIEELKVRGQSQRITVQNKTGGVVTSRYEILTGDGGRDPSQDKRSAGQRVWHIFSF